MGNLENGAVGPIIIDDGVFNDGSSNLFSMFNDCTGSACSLPQDVFIDSDMKVHNIVNNYDSVASYFDFIKDEIDEMLLLISPPCDDIDNDNVCDDIDECIGELDACGTCNGNGFPEGACDCIGTLPNEGENCEGILVNSNFHPLNFSINSVFPNPFNPTVTINFSLEIPNITSIEILDAKGNLVEEISNGFLSAGEHSVVWDGSLVSSGLYFVIISNNNYTLTEKIILLK